MTVPIGFKKYIPVDGKYSDTIGPYYLKGSFPNIEFGVKILEKHTNINNVAHGGFLMGFADTVGGHVSYNMLKKKSVTATFNANFIRPVPHNSWVTSNGHIIKAGKRAVFIEIKVFVKKNIVFLANGLWQIINVDNK